MAKVDVEQVASASDLRPKTNAIRWMVKVEESRRKAGEIP